MRLIVSLLIALTLLVPATYLAAPHIRRWSYVYSLTSSDLDKRHRALQYIVGQARSDERVLAGAVGALRIEDEANFRQIVGALQAAGCWRRGNITDGPWLRWIGLLANEPDTEAGSLAAQRLADLYDLAGDPRVVGLLDVLIGRDEPDVRYNALCAAAELAMSATDRSPYQRMVSVMTTDAEPAIARHAWIFSHYLGQVPDGAPAWLNRAVERTEGPKLVDERYALEPIRALLLSPDAPLRDVGCVLAVRDLEDDALDTLIAGLLRDMNHEATMSGAILSGMTGLHADLLRKRADGEDIWAIRQVIRLGLWMSDEERADSAQVAGLLLAEAAPRSTVIMALLHLQDPRGLDTLLNPRGQAPDDLASLLNDYGWWRVLDKYLPPTAPRWRPGGDPDQQQLPLDLLRDWYLVHRGTLMLNWNKS